MKSCLLLLTLMTALLAAHDGDGATANAKAPGERLMVIHPTPTAEGTDPEQRSRSAVYDGIVEQLTDKGYRVVDKASAEQCSVQIAATHEIDPLLNKAASYGLKFFAEYSIYFRTSTIKKDNDDSKGALVRVSAKIVDNTSSQVLSAKSSEASSSGFSVDDAIDKAGRAAGKKAALPLIAILENSLRESGNNGRLYTITIENPDGGALPGQLLSTLESNSTVAAIRESESGGGKSTFEIIYRGKRDQLDRDLLKSIAELGYAAIKIRSEGNRSTWKIKNRGR